VVIVDSLFAARVFPGEQAVGKRILMEQNGQKTWREIVGVVAPPRLHDLARDVREQIYQPRSQVPGNRFAVVVRGADARALLRPVEQALHGLDALLAIRQLRPLRELVEEARGPARFVTALGSLFGSLALAMAALGLFGVLSFRCGSARARSACAWRSAPARPECCEWWWPLGCGWRCSGWSREWRARSSAAGPSPRRSKGVRPGDAPAWVGAPLLLLSVTLLACWLPARRAARVSPVVALSDG
jgi:hypothetical protein